MEDWLCSDERTNKNEWDKEQEYVFPGDFELIEKKST